MIYLIIAFNLNDIDVGVCHIEVAESNREQQLAQAQQKSTKVSWLCPRWQNEECTFSFIDWFALKI
jgi:hypothetical protein